MRRIIHGTLLDPADPSVKRCRKAWIHATIHVGVQRWAHAPDGEGRDRYHHGRKPLKTLEIRAFSCRQQTASTVLSCQPACAKRDAPWPRTFKIIGNLKHFPVDSKRPARFSATNQHARSALQYAVYRTMHFFYIPTDMSFPKPCYKTKRFNFF